MHHQLLSLVFLAVSLPFLGQANQRPAAPRVEPRPLTEITPAVGRELAAELEGMAILDQVHRTPVSWGTTDPAELARLEALDDDAHIAEWARRHKEGIRLPQALETELMARQSVLDARNVARLAGIIRSYGYPSAERLGVDAPDPVPLLIHASLEDYDAVAPLLLEEARAGRMGARPFAALTDRKRQHRGELQLYGTCRAIDAATGEHLAPLIGDIDATNAARAALGMEPLVEYRVAGEGGVR